METSETFVFYYLKLATDDRSDKKFPFTFFFSRDDPLMS